MSAAVCPSVGKVLFCLRKGLGTDRVAAGDGKDEYGMEWQFLKKLNIDSPYDPAIPLLDKYPEK